VLPLGGRRDLRPAAVVDDDDLLGVAERVQEPAERLARVVGDDDDRSRQ
jgi:hypothetical protein